MPWFTVASLAALLVLFFAAPARAQYRFDHWTADNGLPQNSVRAVLQTRDGYLWLTTFDGLVRFDGVRFTVFNKGNSPGLRGNRFVSLLEDRSGNLWATLENGEVVQRHRGQFAVYALEPGLPDDVRATLSEDGSGNVVVTYQSWDYTGPGNVLTRFTSRAYRCLEGGLQPADELSRTFPWELPDTVSLTGSFWKLHDGDLWICTDDRIFRLLEAGGVRIYDQRSGLPGTQPALVWGERWPLRAVSIDTAGRLWATEIDSGRSELLSARTPEGFDVLCGYADAEGNLWFSTYNNGLFRARRQIVAPFGREQGLESTEVYPVLASRDGSIWIGAGDLSRLEDGAFTRYKIASPFPSTVRSLYEDRAGQVWVNGAWRLAGGRLVRAPWADTIPDTRFLACQTMCEDRAGGFWVGTGTGVARHAGGVSTYFTTRDGLAGDDTKVIVEDGQGGLWLGSYGGLTHYKDGVLTAWTENDGLPGRTVRALKQDVDGTLWIGTYDSGLARFKDGRFTSYGVKDGLFDNGVFQILEDDAGWFWMSCNRGIYRVRKQELVDFAEGRIGALTCVAYNKSDGMPSSECNGGRWPAGARGPDGRLWFPTMNGVAMIDPAAVEPNTQPPPVVIESMRINNEPVPAGVWSSALGEAGPEIRILPGQDNFEIEYTAPSFVNSENIRFKYTLEGLDADWVDAGTRRSAYFSHVPPGSYTFRVIAANSDGVWNTEGAALGLVVEPRFHQTWWFLSLLGVLVVGAGLTVFRVRVDRLERVHRQQEEFSRMLLASQERERQRIAGELHDSLGQSLLIIKNRVALAQSDIDERDTIEEQLDELSYSAAAAIEECREIAYNLRPYQISRFGLSKTLYGIFMRINEVTDIAATAKIDSIDNLLNDEAQLNVYRIVQECANNIIKHSEASEASLSVVRGRGAITLSIQDNGRGITHSERRAGANGRGGFGLIGIAERVRMLDGDLEIVSERGTHIRISIPARG